MSEPRTTAAKGISLVHRLVEAVRRHYRDYGFGPSLGELQLALGAASGPVRRARDLAAKRGLIIVRKGERYGITLPIAGEMISDSEWALIGRSRGLPAALATAFRVQSDTKGAQDMIGLLAQIDATQEASASGGNGSGEAGPGGGGGRATARPASRGAGNGALPCAHVAPVRRGPSGAS